MVNVDLAISVGIWVAGVGMSAVGIEMTINTPTSRTKWWYRLVFAVLGLGFIGLSIWQSQRADAENKRLAVDHTTEQVRNEGNIKFVQGQLDTMSKVLGNLSSNTNPQQTITALKAILPSIESMQSGKSALEKMRNRELQSKVIEFANQMRAFVSKFNDQQQIRELNEQQKMMAVRDDKAKQEEMWNQARVNDMAFDNQFKLDYRQQFSGSARAYRDELIRRLGPQPPETGINRPLAIDEDWIEPMSVETSAAYLEKLARKLP